MEMTMAGGYGLLGVLDLAASGYSSPRVLADVARARGIPENYLRKIFNSLARAGVLRSVRGAHGGFTLARCPAEITVREIIQTSEGAIAIKRCLRRPPLCDRVEQCPLYPMWAEVQDAMLRVLSRWTLEDLLKLDRRLDKGESRALPCPGSETRSA